MQPSLIKALPIVAAAYAERFGAQQPITVLYRPARQAQLGESRVHHAPGAATRRAAGAGRCAARPSSRWATTNTVTVSAAPKIKFMEGSAFRPWIIPIGLDIHVISPPSNRTQYLDLGVQFGGGFEYAVWKAFKVGVDARYHLTARLTNTNNDYFQVGPYVGISF